MEGRFGNLYAVWARRHQELKTPLVILENTPAPCLTHPNLRAILFVDRVNPF